MPIETFECWQTGATSRLSWCRGYVEEPSPSNEDNKNDTATNGPTCPTQSVADCSDVVPFLAQVNPTEPRQPSCTCLAGSTGSLTRPTVFECVDESGYMWCEGTINRTSDDAWRAPACPPVEMTQAAFEDWVCHGTFVFGDAYSCQLDQEGFTCGGVLVSEAGNDDNANVNDDLTVATDDELWNLFTDDTVAAPSVPAPAAAPTDQQPSPVYPPPQPTPIYSPPTGPSDAGDGKPSMVDDEYILFQDDDAILVDDDIQDDDDTNTIVDEIANGDNHMLLAAVALMGVGFLLCWCRSRRGKQQSNSRYTGFGNNNHTNNGSYQGIGGDMGDLELQPTFSYSSESRGMEYRDGSFL